MNKGIFVIFLLLALSLSFSKPCCPEDPDEMTFRFIRNNPDYLIGNHLGERLPPLISLIFRNAKMNGYSDTGDFVIGLETKRGRLYNYSLDEYEDPNINFYAEEEAVDRVWQADHMPAALLREIFFGNIYWRR